ncbi:MAG: ComF family protein [Gemmatimonadetes bacterium]|nr:ComF family protein [Gemmatimonadota bacterium]
MGLLHGLADLVFAPRCLACGGPAGPRPPVCGRCRSRLPPPPPPLCPRCGFPRLRTGRDPGARCQECADWPIGIRLARSACLLRGPAAALVHQLKYRGWRALAGVMAERMAGVPLPGDVRRETGLIVPVPTTRRRVRERGYNQAGLLARALAESTRRTAFCALSRAAAGTSQTTLQPAARRANVAGAFSLAADRRHDIAGEHLLLVDDVLTTGATVTACAEVLVGAGARCVSVLTFARAPGRLRLD